MTKDLFTRLKPAKPITFDDSRQNRQTCLLLDTSASMDIVDGSDPFGDRRIDLLRKAVAAIPNLQGVRAYSFNSLVELIEDPREQIPEPSGSTAMELAFDRAKVDGFTGAVLITDGEPNNDKLAMFASDGLVLDIVYVGKPPVPLFLDRLAKARRGTLQIGNLKETKLLAQTIEGLLPAPGGSIKL